MNFTQDYEVKTDPSEALEEMRRFASDEDIFHPGYGMNLYEKHRHIFQKNMELAVQEGFAKEAYEIDTQHTLKIVAKHNANVAKQDRVVEE